jgi:hypothetical protein
MGPIEQKAYAGPVATLIAGYASTVLIEAVPWVHKHLTPDQQQNLPIIIAFLFSAVSAYLAPHTHRPDLPQPVPVQPAPAPEPLPENRPDAAAGPATGNWPQ